MATQRICSIPGCNKPRLAQERCSTHYSQLFRSGKMKRVYAPHKQGAAFLEAALTSETDDCIIWPYGKSSSGYGEIGSLGAHNIICRRAYGDPPPNKTLACHSCGKRDCVNKRHLRWGSSRDNTDDAIKHKTTLQGERHPNAKISELQAQEILATDKAISHRAVARKFGVTPECVSNIRRGRTWRHLTSATKSEP